MAADNTAATVATQTLVAATDYKVNLTGDYGQVELVHHGGAATETVYYAIAGAEANLPNLAGGGADDERPLLAGERLTVNVRRDGIWIVLISAGTPVVSIEGVLSRHGSGV